MTVVRELHPDNQGLDLRHLVIIIIVVITMICSLFFIITIVNNFHHMLTILGPSPMALFTAEAESIGRERLEVRPSHLLSSSVSTLTICTPINAYLCQSFINPCHCIYQSSPCSRALRSQTLRRCSQDELQPSSGRQLQRRSAQISSARWSNNEVKSTFEFHLP